MYEGRMFEEKKNKSIKSFFLYKLNPLEALPNWNNSKHSQGFCTQKQ